MRAFSNYLYQRPKLVLLLLLGPPLLYMLVVYLGSLFSLLLNSFYYLDGFTGKIVRQFTFRTYGQLFTRSNLEIFQRTTGMAAAVTVADAILAFPLSLYMARYASPRMKSFMYLAVLVPLWSSYLVRVYAWRLILAREGILTWFLHGIGLQPVLDWMLGLPYIGGPSLGLSALGMFLAFCYVWLPYMILPIQTALERVPKSLEEASGDLGARPMQTFRTVTLPLAFPGVVAGSIFTFSLTLGDFIVPLSLGNSSPYIGTAVLSHQGTSGNIPLAAAFIMGPVVIMIIYLLLARRLGAFDAL
jgi:putative spermidine/putrescine transport system permease protein